MQNLNELFEAAKRSYKGDNRNRTHKTLQELLNSDLISVYLSEYGRLMVSPAGFAHHIKIVFKKTDGRFITRRVKLNSKDFDAYDVLMEIGKFLQSDEVKAQLKSIVNIDSSCQKCNGTGIIPAFHYYCQGICFDCFGYGYNHKFKHEVKIINQ